MNSAVGEGRTFEEAVERAVRQLGVRIDQVDVNLMEEKRGMFFGLFGGKIKVKVTHQSPTEDRIDEILSGIMKRLAIPSQVEVNKRAGDFYVNRAGAPHFVWSDEPMTVQLTGIGPWAIHPLD